MQNELFRKKSLDRISSPEELHDYMRVTSPWLWILLVFIVVFLAGLFVYAATAVMEITMPIKLELKSVDELELTWVSARLPLTKLDTVATGMMVRMGDEEGTIEYISADENKVYLEIDMEDEYIPLPDGEYDAVLVLNSTTPLKYLSH